MSVEKINLGAEVQGLAETINSDDERASIALEVSSLKLQREKVKLELEKVSLDQERERLRRIQKNSGRRPSIFFALVCVIILFYGGFFMMVLGGPAVGVRNVALSDAQVRLYAVEIFLLGVIPTVLVAFLMKAIFSATEKKEDKSTQISITDAAPVKSIAEQIAKQ